MTRGVAIGFGQSVHESPVAVDHSYTIGPAPETFTNGPNQLHFLNKLLCLDQMITSIERSKCNPKKGIKW